DRGQLAVFIARAMLGGDEGVPDASGSATFPDVSRDLWCAKHIEYCVQNEVVQGYDDGLYHPESQVTRDQMAVYIARAFELPR
ncbi:MAG: hypothetical protein GTN78_20045, partial [Gemmatimonadales bacterium]|nr:hypothetical protein [Gemmatimonadales bacterium]